MNKTGNRIILLGGLFFLGSALIAQFKPEEIARDKDWEEFMATAKMTMIRQMGGSEAVTNPYQMVLEKDGEKQFAVWKNPEGRPKGYLEGWMWEIAAYRLDRYLGLNMVPVTIERRYEENRGSLQLWVEGTFPYHDVLEGKAKRPGGIKAFRFNRAAYLQRAFDNLICNEDRHANNILITEDWRLILIDHSRSFRTTGRYGDSLIFNENSKKFPGTMSALPAVFIEKLKLLTPEVLHQITGPYLTDKEIKAVLIRRDLILKEIDRLVEKYGKNQVIY
ncbi:MAG: hypothetical protein NTW38_00125 [Candidatus Aminicenantes bacterium]|nr:hypothetical protein [Candidatus Aminicenantes bacterium]